MAFAPFILPIAAIGMQAMQPIMQGFQQSQQYGQQAQIASYNANLARQQAQQAGMVGAQNEASQRTKSAMVLGDQAAAIGESGTGIQSGSAQDVMRQSAKFAELDALNKRYEGQMQRFGYMSEAQGQDYASQVARRSGSNALTGGYLGAGTSILSGVSDYGMGSGWFKKGGFLGPA